MLEPTENSPLPEAALKPGRDRSRTERLQFAPLGTRRSILRESVAICDVLTLVLTLLASYWIAYRLAHREMLSLNSYLWILWVILPAWLFSLRWVGLYFSISYASAGSVFLRLLKAHVGASLLTLSALYVTKSVEVSRVMMQSFIIGGFVMLLVQKLTLRAAVERWRRSVARQRARVLLIAAPHRAKRYEEMTRNHASLAEEVIGLVTPDAPINVASEDIGIRILGRLHDLPRIVRQNIVDEVVLFSPIDQTQFEQLVAHCAERGLSVRMMVEVPSAALGTWQMDKWAENTFFISLSALPQDPLQLAAKRIIDVAGALVGLSLFALTWAIYGRRLKRESHGTVLFKQRRVGMNGRRFLLHKFRTMYHDSEHRKEGLHTLNQMRGPMFKLKDDPRITPTGRKLRRRHLDELPQFWNVLKGEMSLVGTRPPTEDEVAQYQDWHHRRLSIKPGITGLWQLNGNHRVRDFEEVVKLDCEYIDKWSLWLDLRIMVGTISKVMRADGW